MRERRLHRALIALASVAAAGPAARADQLPRVGVAVATEVNIAPADAQAMSEALGKALHQELLVDVIAGVEAARRLPEDGVPDGCAVDRACVADVAHRLSADQLLFLVVVRVGTRVQVDSTWVDPATGKSASRPAVVIDSGEEAASEFAAAASALMPDARRRPPAPVVERLDAGGVAPPADEPALVTRQVPRRMTTGAWIAAGAGGAALAGAVTFTLLTRSDHADCDVRADCSDEELDAIDRKALAADLLWGAALASGVTAGVLYWMSGGPIEQVPAGSIGLRPGPGTVGLAVGGSL